MVHTLKALGRAFGEVASSARAQKGDGGSGDEGRETEAALSLVEEINLLSWRYFVASAASEGEAVLTEVCCMCVCVCARALLCVTCRYISCFALLLMMFLLEFGMVCVGV